MNAAILSGTAQQPTFRVEEVRHSPLIQATCTGYKTHGEACMHVGCGLVGYIDAKLSQAQTLVVFDNCYTVVHHHSHRCQAETWARTKLA